MTYLRHLAFQTVQTGHCHLWLIVNNSWLTLDGQGAIRALFHFRLAPTGVEAGRFFGGLQFSWREAGGMVIRDETPTSSNLGCGLARARARASAASP